MIKLPEVNKRNWKKVLRELDISAFPSLTPALTSLRKKIKDKEKLSFAEDFSGPNLLKKYFDEYNAEINSFYLSNIDWSIFDNKPPKDERQKDGVKFLLQHNRCILADTMGLGKTLTSIYASLLLEENAKILVVTPKSLKYSFVKEIQIFTDNYHIVDKEFIQKKFVIVHYEQLKKYYDEIIKFNPNIVIADEAHLIKNLKSIRGRYFQEILKKNYPNKLWLLTGTPIANRPSEFYSLLKLIKHPEAGNWQKYMITYCAAFQNHWGQWDTSGASNLDLLHQRTKDVVLRRVNQKGELPPFERTPIFLTMTPKEKKQYENVIENYELKKTEEFIKEFGELADLGFETKANEMTKMVLWRQYCAILKAKSSDMKELINERLNENEENKIIIFTNYTAVINQYKEMYPDNSLILDGRITNAEERQKIVDEFNSNPNIKLMFANIMVGGTGYNIQSANYIIVNDMDLVPYSMLQAEARAWRYGQTKSVEAIYPIYDDSIEEILYKLIDNKMEVITTVVDGQTENYFESMINANKGTSKKDILDEIFKQFKF